MCYWVQLYRTLRRYRNSLPLINKISAINRTFSPGFENSFALKVSTDSKHVSIPWFKKNTLRFIVLLLSRGKKGKDMSLSFIHVMALSPWLKNNSTLKWISDNFPGMLTYVKLLEFSWNYISMYLLSPFKRKSS